MILVLVFCFLLVFPRGSSYFSKLASLWFAIVMVTWWRKRQIIWGYVLPMVHTHLVVIVMLRQKGKRSKVTFDKGCTGGCSPSWGGCRAGHEQPGQGNPLPPSYILIRTTNQCGNKNLTLRLIYILLNIQIREGVKKNRFFLGKSPKQRTQPTHCISLGLT